MTQHEQLLWQEVDGEVLPPDPSDYAPGDPNAPIMTEQDTLMPHDPSSTPAPADFTRRNYELKKLIRPNGTLSQLGKREGERQLKQEGWLPPALRDHKARKGDHTAENRKKLEEQYGSTLAAACGACALSTECSLANDPSAFRERFYAAGTRQKLLRRLDSSDPAKQAVQCDDITPSKH